MDDYNFYRDKNKNSSSRGFLSHFIIAIIGAVVGGMLVLTFAPAALLGRIVPEDNIETQKSSPAQEVQKIVMPETKEISLTAVIAKKVMPAVVGIRTTKYKDSMFFGKTKLEGIGSGVIVDKQGYILTNNHVADDTASDITVYLADGNNVTAKTVWTDGGLDLSILKVEGENLTVAEIGNSDTIEVGEMAVAIGNPLGLSFQRSVTKGIISALNRSIPMDNDKFMEDLIQTDASINEGNSGGPLINSEGKVIGINTIKVSTAEGMGFAVPVNTVVPVIKSLIETGRFNTPYIGINGLDKEIANFYNYKIDKGIFIASIDRSGPSYKAGLRKGDIILEMNDNPVNTLVALKQNIFSMGAGKSIKIKYQERNADIKILNVVLGESDKVQ